MRAPLIARQWVAEGGHYVDKVWTEEELREVFKREEGGLVAPLLDRIGDLERRLVKLEQMCDSANAIIAECAWSEFGLTSDAKIWLETYKIERRKMGWNHGDK